MSNAHAPLRPDSTTLDPFDGGGRAVQVRTFYRQVMIGSRHLGDPRIKRARRRSRSSFMIGCAAGVDSPVSLDYIAAAAHALVAPGGAGFVINVTAPMRGELAVGDEITSLGELVRQHGASFALPPSGHVRLECGETTFLVDATSMPRKLAAPWLTWRWDEQRYHVGTAVALGLFLLMIVAIPPDPRSLSLDRFDARGRFAKILIKPPEEKPAELPAARRAQPSASPGGRGARPRDAEGSLGQKTARDRAARLAIQGPEEHRDWQLAKRQAVERIESTAILGVLARLQGSPVASIFARDSALGSDAESALGDLVANQEGLVYGAGGLGPLGTGAGGGGSGEATLGLGGRMATVGEGGGADGGRGGYGRAVGGLAARRPRTPDFLPGIPQVRGALDREIVRRVIRSHINEVKFCYEQEMTTRSELGGRIMVQFTIAPGGQVLTSVLQSSTMGNARVENCTVQAVRRWEFPKPQGGGLVMVSYPFVLTPAGGGA
jgi:TonB family protein